MKLELFRFEENLDLKNKVIIMSENGFDAMCQRNKLDDGNVEKVERTAFISIVDVYRRNKNHFNDNHPNVLNLSFSDVTDDNISYFKRAYNNENFELLSESDADKAVKFIYGLAESVDLWVVHCLAGISRSGAFGHYITELMGWDIDEYYRINPRVNPNPYVLRKLKESNNRKSQKYNWKPIAGMQRLSYNTI